jgi:hypothetical protein
LTEQGKSYYYSLVNKDVSNGQNGNSQNIANLASKTGTTNWKEYKNVDYGFSIKTPSLLFKNEIETPKDYLLFIRFEENKFSKDKGMALGITGRNIEEETEKIINTFKEEDEKINPIKGEFEINGNKGISIYVEAINDLEERSVYILNNGKHTFSISTTPDQIEKAAASLTFF